MKRFTSWLVISVLLLSMLPLWVLAAPVTALASDVENAVLLQSKSATRKSGNWVYSVMNHGIASIEGYSGDATSLKIPTEIDGYPVGAIGDGAFASQRRLTSITIPTQVFSIGDGVFYNPSALTITGYDGSVGMAWAKSNGATANSLTRMYLNSGVVDLSGTGNTVKKTGNNTLEVNSALSYVLKPGTMFFFEATDKYRSNYWGGEINSVQRHENGATVNYTAVEPRMVVDKVIASSDMEGIRMEFIPDPDLMVYTDDGDTVEAAKVEWEIHVLGDIWGRVSDSASKTLINTTIDVFGVPVKIRSDFHINFSCYYDPNLFSSDVATASLNFDVTTTINAKAEVKWSRTKTLGKVVIFGVDGFGLTIPIDLVVSAKASIEIDIKDVVSVNWSYDSRKNNSIPKPVPVHTTPVSKIIVTGEIKVGLQLGITLELCYKRIVYFGIEGGIHGIARATVHSLLVDKMCVDLELRLYVQLNLSCLFLGSKSWGPYETTIWYKHYEFESFSPFRVNEVPTCTRKTKTISFNLNGGEPMDIFSEKKVEWGSTFSIGAPTRYKHTFKGWYLNPGLTERWTNESRVYNDITLYAKWERNYEPVTSITVNKSTMTLHSSGADRTGKITATISPSDATNKGVKWSSSDKSVATVDANGNVTGIAKGTATITATSADNASKKATCTVTVQQYVTKINVAASNTTPLRLGTTQVSAEVLPGNANNRAYTWSSSNTNVATVNSNGVVTAKNVGQANIIATAQDGSGVQGSVTINVQPIPVASVTVSKETAEVYTSGSNKTIQLTASILPTNADDQSVTWESDNPGLASVNANGVVTGMCAGTVVIRVRSHFNPSIYDECTVTVKQLVTRLTLNKTSANLETGATTQLNVTVVPNDATNKSVRWVSSNPNVASVNNSGLVTAVGGGDAVISVVSQDGSLVIAQCVVHVSGVPASPATPDPSVSVQSIALDFDAIRVFTRGASQNIQLHAYVSPANAGNPQIVWSSSNTAVATVDNTGKVTGVKGGSAVITAKSAANGSIQAVCNVTVEQLADSITLNKTSQSILKGEETVQLTGTVLPANATNRTIKWVSGDSGIAVVDYTGLVSGVGLGSTVITAETVDGSGVTASFQVTVLPVPVRSVTLDASSAVAYTSGRDHEIQLNATALPVHAEDRTLTWSSSNPAVASVDASGKVTGLSQGTAVITVQSVSNPDKTAACTVTVKTWVTGIELQMERKVMEPGETLQITASVAPNDATDKTVTWSSSNPNVITVNNGLLSALNIGSCVITASANDGSGVSASETFTVMENPVYEITLGQTAIEVDTSGSNRSHQLTWEVLPAKATDKSVSWFSSDSEVASVDDMGNVTGRAGGTAVITVQSDSNPEITAQCTVTVNQKVQAIFLTTEKAALVQGETVQMQVEVGPTQATNTAVRWASSNENVATVSQNGLVTAVNNGTAVISVTAQDGSGVSASETVTVEKWINLSGNIPNTSYYLGGSVGIKLGEVMLSRSTVERIASNQLNAVWTLTGGGEHTRVTVTQQPLVYLVNGAETSVNIANLALDQMLSAGTDTYTLTCTAGTHSDSISFQVTCTADNYANEVQIGFNDVTVSMGQGVTIPAVPTAKDGRTLPDGLTLSLSGDDVEKATVTDIQGGKTISFDKSSIYTVTAEYSVGNISYSVPVTIRVKGADGLVKLPVQEVVLSAQNASMVLNETLSLQAIGVYGSEEVDCTFTWSSSDENVATVDTNGQVTAIGFGSATIYAYPDNGDAYGWCTIQVGNVLDFAQDSIDVTIYLGGEENVELANVLITNASSNRLQNLGLIPDWKIEKISGTSADLAVQELEFNSNPEEGIIGALIDLVRIYSEGDTSFRLICTADTYQATLPITIHVVSPAKALPTSVTLQTANYTTVINESVLLKTDIAITPSSAALPDDVQMTLDMSGAFGRAVSNYTLNEAGLELVFAKSGTYSSAVVFYGTNYSYEAPFTVTVADENGVVAKLPEEVTVTPEYLFLMPGETGQLTAAVLPDNANNKTVVWSSYDNDVATVSQTGLVTAVGAGSTVIHVASADSDVYYDVIVNVESGLSMDRVSDTMNVYLDGLTRTTLNTYYLSYASSVRSAGKTPSWTLTRVSGSNLTLKAIPTEEVSADGIVRLGAVVSLYAVTRTGTAVYDLTCAVDGETATTRLTVNALERSSSLPDHLMLDTTDYYASVDELIVYEPEIACIPETVSVPADLRVSFELDDNAVAVVNENDYFVSRARSTFSFCRAGTYYANAVYACGNVHYTIPIVFHIADQTGDVPVFVSKLTSDPRELFLEKGSTAVIRALVSPLDATDQNVTYTSTNTGVATVSQNGTVTAVSEGYTQIIITPSDAHVPAAVCNVTVEKGFNVISASSSASLYLQGTQMQNLSSFALTDGTLQRLTAQGLTPEWTVTRKSGNAATYGVTVTENNQQLTLTTESLRRGGTDVYTVTCTAGSNVWSKDFTLNVIDLSGTLPESIAAKNPNVTVQVGQSKTINFTPVFSPSGASLPSALASNSLYSGLGTFYNALNYDVYSENGNQVTVAFTKPGTYLLARTWYHLNLQYSALCVITVTGGSEASQKPLLSLSDAECTVYAGGKSTVAVTAEIYDAFAYEAFADDVTWNLERISGSAVTASLVSQGQQVGLYVANVKKTGTDVWRLTCSLGGYSEYADITVHAIVPRTALPDSISLPQDTFTSTAGKWIFIPFDVTAQPEDTRLPDTGKDFWSLQMRDTENDELTEINVSDTGINVRFSEVGSYSGTLVYASGNAKYEVPVYFYITDEQGQVTDENLKLEGNFLVNKVWMDGLTGVGIGHVTLVDSDNGIASGAGAALVKKAGAVWNITVTSGSSRGRLSIAETEPGQAAIILVSASSVGAIKYTATCTVNGNTYSYNGTVNVVDQSTAKPVLNMSQTSYTLAVGETVLIDRRILNADTGAQFASASDKDWKNSAAISAMGYGFESNGDTWVATFYEKGTYHTAVEVTVGNLVYSLPISFNVLAQGETGQKTTLRMPTALTTIEAEAMLGVAANIVDLRGSNITTIGSKAFGENEHLEIAYLPSSITSMADDVFSGSPYVIIVCPKGSYAERWAAAHGFAVYYAQ